MRANVSSVQARRLKEKQLAQDARAGKFGNDSDGCKDCPGGRYSGGDNTCTNDCQNQTAYEGCNECPAGWFGKERAEDSFCAMYALPDGGVKPLLLQMAAFVASAGLVTSTDFRKDKRGVLRKVCCWEVEQRESAGRFSCKPCEPGHFHLKQHFGVNLQGMQCKKIQ